MTDARRFERGEQYSSAQGVITYRGVDPVTGLDVLIYEFDGDPTLEAGPPLSSHALQVLLSEAGSSGSKGRLVAAYPSGASLLAPGESAVDDRFVLRAMQGLKEAHAHGASHGDINPGRLLYSLGDVYIEGFGVPWPGRSPDLKTAQRSDVVALAKALLALARDNLSVEVAAALRSAEAANPPLTAERLHAIVNRLAGGVVKGPASGFVDLTLPTTGTRRALEGDTEAGSRPSAAAGPAGTTAAARQPEGATGDLDARARGTGSAPTAAKRPEASQRRVDDPEPITLQSDPGISPPEHGRDTRSPKDTSPGFVKALPPGAKYRQGNLDEGPRPAPIRMDRQDSMLLTRRRSWRGPALLLLMVLTAGLAAYLAMLNRADEPQVVSSPFESYLVDVRVQPASMPPVDLYVVQSPSGSRYAQGARLGSVPNRLPFDAAGTWTVYGRFLSRQTQPVSLTVPRDTTITLVFPEED